MKLEKSFLKIIKNAAREKTKAYDVTATVMRTEQGTAWVHIDGGVDETPAEMTISAQAGDIVKVRVSGGKAYLLGNNTAPPTDDRTAVVALGTAGVARKTAVSAEKTANVTEQKTRPAITSMTTYFKLSNGTPAQPTEEDHAGWSEEEPLWDPESDEQLYYSVRTRTVQGVISWTYPHVLSSYANIAILQNAILLEVGDGSALVYIDDDSGDHILDNTGDPILANIGSIRDAYSYMRIESDKIRSEVSETYVSKGNSQIQSLSSVMEQTADGLDIYSTVNGSVQATHTHIDGDSFDIVKDGATVASFGVTSTIGDSTRTVDPQDRDNFAQISASGFRVFEKSTYWGDYHAEIEHNAIKLFLDSIFSAMTDNRVFRNFFVSPTGMTFGHPAENTYFSVSTYPNDTTEPTMWEYQTGIRIGGTVLTENDLKKLKALIS